MSNQEMQFADPDWKPSQQLEAKPGAQEREPFTPQPINDDRREQAQWRAAPPQQEGYTGLPPYAGAAPQQVPGRDFRQRQYRRRGRSPWFWIILAFIILALMSGGFGSRFSGRFDSPNGPNMNFIKEASRTFSVNGQPTIVINDNSGSVHILTSDNANSVTFQETRNAGFFGNGNNTQVAYSQSPDGSTVNAGVIDSGQGSVDLNVTIPQGANLEITTNSGDITIGSGVSGKMTLKTDNGTVTASNDTLSGTSTINTNSGDVNLQQTALSDQAAITTNSGAINFDGTIGTSGSYLFHTGSGSIDVTVPGTSAFQLDATTNSGTIDPGGFQGVNVQGSKASGNVGGRSQAPAATLTLNTDSGDIILHKQ
jgi:hypothetical protein